MTELIEWLRALDPVFAFLLALPFAVAAAGLAAEFVRRSRRRRAVPPKQESSRYVRPRNAASH